MEKAINPTELERKTAHYIRQNALFTKENRLLVALSGGADSVALVHILIRLGYTCEAAHCNFHLRGSESDRDAAFVEQLCQQLGIRLHQTDFDTTGYASAQHLSIEMAARQLRYQWFDKVCKESGCTHVAVAHHRDDSVETLLLNLVRGTGIHGLQGIRPKNGNIVRPLLNADRSEIEHYLDSMKQPYVTDSTNLHDDYTRNKIRLNILPLMEEINPSVKQTIDTTAHHLREAGIIYDQAIAEATGRVFDGEVINIEGLMKELLPHHLLFTICQPYGFNASQVESMYAALNNDKTGQRFVSTTHEIVKDRKRLILRPIIQKEEQESHRVEELPWHLCLNNRESIQFDTHEMSADFVIPKTKDKACVDKEKVQLPLTLRKVKRGDRFVPFGMNGKKLVSDYMTDRKFSHFQKEAQWVVTDAHGEIVWIVNERSDNRFRILPQSTHEILVMTWEEKKN